MPDSPIQCPNCGNSVTEEQRFCGRCGASLRQICPVCGSENPHYYQFCGQCGASLRQAAPTDNVLATSREERRWVTVLLADLSGFTAMSERMDPEDVRTLADRCVEQLSQEIYRFGGTVINVVGDEVVAVFGAPVAHEDDAERAVRAGLSMCGCKLTINPESNADGGEQAEIELPIKVHVGINTGEVMAGLTGPQGRRDYNVMGDTVNTAARLLSAAPPGRVYVGLETYHATQRVVRYGELPPIFAKGKEQPVPAWEALEVIGVPQARPLGSAPLIGRDNELNLLLSLWERVTRDNQPHLVTLLGEPGIGKSRLSAEFERRLPPGVRVLHGRCLPYGEALGYWALATMLKEAANITAEDTVEGARSKLSVLVDSVSQLGLDNADEVALHLALLSGLDTEADRLIKSGDQRAMHASVRRFLEALARQFPLCLIFEDIHWADDALLDLIELVAGRIHASQILIVTQARPELLEKRPAWGRGVRAFTSLPLHPLSGDMESELIMELCRERGVEGMCADEIGHRPGGNPLFIEEMVAMIAERGEVTGVPSLIKLLIAARFDALPVGERNMIQLAAVFGNTFWESGLRALGAGTRRDIREHLEALEQKDLLRVQPRSQFRDEREFIFKHDLIQDVAYHMLPRSERQALHGLVVDWLEERPDKTFDLLAYHAVQAGQQGRAVTYLMQAAERAGRAAAHRQEAALLSEALELATRSGQTDLLPMLHARRGSAYTKEVRWAEARPDLEAALNELPPDAQQERIQVLIDLAITSFWLLDIPRVRQCARDALQMAEKVGWDELISGALGILALAENSDGNLQEGMKFYKKALAHSGRISTTMGPAVAIGNLSFYWMGRNKQAIRIHQEALRQYRDLDDIPTMVSIYAQLGLSLAGGGRYREAEEAFIESVHLGREHEVWPFVARTIAMSAGYHLDLFDFAGNEALANEARQVAMSSSFPPPAASAGIDLLLNYARRHEVGLAEKLLPEIAATVEKASGFHGWLWRLRLAEAQAEIALASGDWEESLRYAQSAIQQSQARGRVKYHILGLDTYARALLKLERTPQAITALQEAIPLARKMGDPTVFLRPASTLLSIEGDDALHAEVQTTLQDLLNAIPTPEMRRKFEEAEPIQQITALAR